MSFPAPYLQFIDSKGKIHATPALAAAADLADLLGSEVVARQVLANRQVVTSMINHVYLLEAERGDRLEQQAEGLIAIRTRHTAQPEAQIVASIEGE